MGAIARVQDGAWELLDDRERAYERHDVTAAIACESPVDLVRAYAIAEGQHMAPTAEHPILQSYVDVVLAGYDRVYGPDGVRAFVETTSGWEAPILQDRAAPRYPRHQSISAGDLARYDALLDQFAVTRI